MGKTSQVVRGTASTTESHLKKVPEFHPDDVTTSKPSDGSSHTCQERNDSELSTNQAFLTPKNLGEIDLIHKQNFTFVEKPIAETGNGFMEPKYYVCVSEVIGNRLHHYLTLSLDKQKLHLWTVRHLNPNNTSSNNHGKLESWSWTYIDAELHYGIHFSQRTITQATSQYSMCTSWPYVFEQGMWMPKQLLKFNPAL